MLLLFEDVHWAAEATLDWLTYITPRISGSRLLVVMTYRTDAVGSEHAVVRLGRRFTREGVVSRLALQPLTREAHLELVAQMSGLTGEQAVIIADRLFRETAGHPFFLHELVRGLIDAGQITVEDDTWTGAFVEAGPEADIVFPDSLRAIVNERVDRMSARARLFLKTAAVVGRVFPYDLLLHAGDWTDEVALEAVEEVLARGFIRPGAVEGEFIFAHHLMQEAIYMGLTAPRRAYLHRLVAQALVQAASRQAPSARPALAGAIVHHALRSENNKLVFHWAHLAAQHTASLHAYADALQALDAASNALDRLRHDPDFDLEAGERQHIQVLLDRADLMMPVGRPMEEYGPVVHAIGDLLMRYPDDPLYARYCLQRAAYLSWLSQYEPAAQAALEAYTCLMKLGDHLRAARSLVMAARYRATISQCRAARQLLEQALGLAQTIGNTAVQTQCEIGLPYEWRR